MSRRKAVVVLSKKREKIKYCISVAFYVKKYDYLSKRIRKQPLTLNK